MAPGRTIRIQNDILLVQQDLLEELRRAIGKLQVVVGHDFFRHSLARATIGFNFCEISLASETPSATNFSSSPGT